MKTFLVFLSIAGPACFLHASPQLSKMQDQPNGRPNPSVCLFPDTRELNVFADLLVWTVKEPAADCWAEVIISDSSSLSDDLHAVHFGWDPGLRIGIDYKMNHDQWDTEVSYTWFRTQGNSRIASGPGTVHSSFLGNFYVDNQSGAGLSGPAYQKAGIHWTILFNMFDWDLGRNYWISQSISLRPFGGLKAGWIHQSMHSKWENPDLPSPEYFNQGTEDLKNHFWGIGPEAGINAKLILISSQYHNFHLFGNFSGAMMWGHWSFGDVYNNDLQQKILINLQNVRSGASMLRSFMGFGWDVHFNTKSLFVKLGYEMQFWLDQLQYYSFTGGRLDNELTLQGGMFEICYEF